MLIIVKVIVSCYWESIYRDSWTLQKDIFIFENIRPLIMNCIFCKMPRVEDFHEIENITAYPAKEAEEDQWNSHWGWRVGWRPMDF